MKINFKPSKDIDEKRVIHSKCHYIKIMNGNETDKLIENLIWTSS